MSRHVQACRSLRFMSAGHTVRDMTHRHDHDSLITREAAAAELRVSSRTIDRYAKRGLLTRYETAGGLPRYDRNEVERLHPRPVVPPQEMRTAP